MIEKLKRSTHIEHLPVTPLSLCKEENQAENKLLFFYVLLTVHLSITLVNDQLDAHFFYFLIRLLQPSTCFEQRRAHHQDVKFY